MEGETIFTDSASYCRPMTPILFLEVSPLERHGGHLGLPQKGRGQLHFSDENSFHLQNSSGISKPVDPEVIKETKVSKELLLENRWGPNPKDT